jgi:putative tryptophan/tyrosine transport system substrate-binding protein
LKKVGWSSILIVVVQLAVGVTVEAQRPGKVPRIGFVSARADPTPTTPDSSADALRQGLRNLGYIEGKNIVVEYRYFEGKVDRIPSLVAELLPLNLDVLVSVNTLAIRTFKQATKTLPIVIVINDDPVTTGIVNSLARPGGNVTGLTRLTRELSGKRLELLKEAVVGISRVGILWDTNAGPGPAIALKEYQAAADGLKIQLQSLAVPGPNPDLEGAFRAAAKGRASALIVIASFVLSRYSKHIAELAIKNRLPSMNESSAYVEAGGLMSYSANNAESYRRAAWYVDKILKGAKPADLPVEQPTKFELVINLKTAKALGLTIPPIVLMRAEKVIK